MDNLDQSKIESKINNQYDQMVEDSLIRNDSSCVLELKWCRLVLTQKYGFWIG